MYPRRGAFQIDPNVAIRDNLDAVFDGTNQMPVSDFMAGTGPEIAIIDGGLYRREVRITVESASLGNS